MVAYALATTAAVVACSFLYLFSSNHIAVVTISSMMCSPFAVMLNDADQGIENSFTLVRSKVAIGGEDSVSSDDESFRTSMLILLFSFHLYSIPSLARKTCDLRSECAISDRFRRFVEHV